MNSEKKEKPRMLAATEEVDKISRSMLVWANTFPEKPVDIIKYEFLSADQGDETGMALSTIQGTYITKRFILGGYQAEYQFKLIYRIKPGRSNDKRLEADELLFQSTHPARGATANFTKEQGVCLAQFAYLHKGKKAEHTKTNAPMLH